MIGAINLVCFTSILLKILIISVLGFLDLVLKNFMVTFVPLNFILINNYSNDDEKNYVNFISGIKCYLGH